MKKILVSQCLYGGNPVRYDGIPKAEKDPQFLKWKSEGRLIPACPEVFGGLPVPRPPAQRKCGNVVTEMGRDVTLAYLKGAEEAVRIAKENNIICALMKEKSPSCGSSLIYDGTFSGKLIEGEGLTTEFLRKAGFKVFSEGQLDEVQKLIDKEGKISLTKNIVLIGMPSCGKSVTGVVLAKSLKMNFLDTDLLIQEKVGKSLQDIINQDGVEYFKKIEEEVLCSVDTQNTVIATGGSAVYYESAMEHLGKNSIIVYIEVTLDIIKQRLKNIKTRGVAMQKGQSIQDLYDLRAPLYEKYADCKVQSDKHYIENTVADIIDAVINKEGDGSL